jgi:hypothetical protein
VSVRPQLSELHVADPPERWQALGFSVEDGHLDLGGVQVTLGAKGRGITHWAIHGIPDTAAVDGLSTAPAPHPPRPQEVTHPNTATGIDHVVIITPDFERTQQALHRAGLSLTRIRRTPGFRQGFRRLGPAILELVETTGAGTAGPARFWGLVIIVADLPALAGRLGGDLGTPKPAVQPGRQIATLKSTAGLSPRVAFMTPEPD